MPINQIPKIDVSRIYNGEVTEIPFDFTFIPEETEKNAERNGELLLSRTAYLCERLSMVKGIKLYSKPNPCGIVSFSASGTDSNSFADILSSDFDIAVRGGFHCAPLLHKFLKYCTS